MRLYLASTSPARRALLAQTGIEPVLVAPGVDEDAAVDAASAELGRELTGPELVGLLAVAKADAVAYARIAGSAVDGFVFGGDSACEVDGVLHGKPHDPDVITQQFESACRRAGVKRIRFHTLKHTHATLLLVANVNPKIVMQRLGHSSIVVTMDRYSHVLPGLDQDAAARMAALVSGGL